MDEEIKKKFLTFVMLKNFDDSKNLQYKISTKVVLLFKKSMAL